MSKQDSDSFASKSQEEVAIERWFEFIAWLLARVHSRGPIGAKVGDPDDKHVSEPSAG
jgi:hypothetical protein